MKGKIYTLPKKMDFLKENVQKIYFNHKTNELVLDNKYKSKNLQCFGVEAHLHLTKKLELNQNTDTYIGVALLICSHIFGSNTKYRNWVDEYFMGKRPEDIFNENEDIVKEQDLDEVLNKLALEQVNRVFEVGQRILFIHKEKTIIGTIKAIKSNGQYEVIGNNNISYTTDINHIIRKCRKANKVRE